MRRNGVQRCARLLVVSLALCLLAAVPAPASDSTSTSAGSGFIVTADGYILTNEHVVGDSETVTVYVGNDSYAATVVMKSVESDLALLKIAASGLTPVALGNSLFVQLLDDVVALGFPLPQFGRDLTVSEGRITSFRTNVEGREGRDTLQHDAVITHGSSGGPLFNLKGEVVGVNFAGVEGSGMQLAIPINEAVPLLRSIPSFNPSRMGSATQMLSAQDIVARCRKSIVYIEVATVINWQNLLPSPEAVSGFPEEFGYEPSDWAEWLVDLGFPVIGAAGLTYGVPVIPGYWNDIKLFVFSDAGSASRALRILLDQIPPSRAASQPCRYVTAVTLSEGASTIGGVPVSLDFGCWIGSCPQGASKWTSSYYAYGASVSGVMVFGLGSVVARIELGWATGLVANDGAPPFRYQSGYLVQDGQRLISAEEVLTRLEQVAGLVIATVTNKLAGQ